MGHFSRRQKQLTFVFSDEAQCNPEIDLIVLPVVKVESFYKRDIILRNWLPKVIACGSQSLLRKAFLLGCADYLKEPWDVAEFEIRISRIVQEILANYNFSGTQLRFDGTKLVFPERTIALTYQEFIIFKRLLQFRGEMVPREVLAYSIGHHTRQSRIIDMHISVLRRKLKDLQMDTSSGTLIQAVRGQGYILNT